MKNIKEHADELRSMAQLLNEAADALGQYHDNQLRNILGAMGLSADPFTSTESKPEIPLTVKLRREYAELPPSQRTLDSRLYLARKYSITEPQVMAMLEGPVINGAGTRK